jgi:hypothetical protein
MFLRKNFKRNRCFYFQMCSGRAGSDKPGGFSIPICDKTGYRYGIGRKEIMPTGTEFAL